MFQQHVSRETLYYLLKLAKSESYKQIGGASMGSPLGHTLANAFLCHYEKLWLDNCPPKFKPVVYRRYADHIFVFFKSKDHLLVFTR